MQFAFSPGHITGIFTIEDGSSNGAGFTLSNGMKTSVAISSLSGSRTDVLINGKRSAAPVSRSVVRRFRTLTGCEASLAISHKADFPIGYGIGMSAAGSLSLSLALNMALRTGLTKEGCSRIGFASEVECGTGLSAIFAEALGGFVTRKSLGGDIARLRLRKSERGMPVVCAFLAPIKTASIINSGIWKAKITSAGRTALEQFWQEKSLANFIECSRAFTFKSGVASPRMKKLLDENPRASMAMLGETLFEFTDEPDETKKRFKRFSRTVVVSRLGERGSHLL